MAAAGAALLVLGLLAYPPVAVIGAAVALWGAIQWLMFANRDINRREE